MIFISKTNLHYRRYKIQRVTLFYFNLIEYTINYTKITITIKKQINISLTNGCKCEIFNKNTK